MNPSTNAGVLLHPLERIVMHFCCFNNRLKARSSPETHLQGAKVAKSSKPVNLLQNMDWEILWLASISSVTNDGRKEKVVVAVAFTFHLELFVCLIVRRLIGWLFDCIHCKCKCSCLNVNQC